MPTKLRRRFKIIKTNMRSANGQEGPWVVGEWRTLHRWDSVKVTVRELELCHMGYHCSDHFINATKYVFPGRVAIVETKGRGKESTADKSVWLHMRVVSVHRWSNGDTRALYIYVKKLLKDPTRPLALRHTDLYEIREVLWPRIRHRRALTSKVDAWVVRRLRANKITPKKQ